MFIVTQTFKVPRTEIDKYQQAHRDYLDYYYKQGIFLASGPTKPHLANILIASIKDRGALEKLLKEDPYYLAELADFSLVEFTPIHHRDELKNIILKTEGKLC